MSVLPKSEIDRLIKTSRLIEGYLDLSAQLQPNGFDITVRDMASIEGPGTIASSNSGRELPGSQPLAYGQDGLIMLQAGSYMITYNEVVNLPNHVMALARPRSSLLRCGVDIGTAVWDAGYSGRSQSLLIVHNLHGFRLQRNARVAQLVFFTLTSETEGYNGMYQNENT